MNAKKEELEICAKPIVWGFATILSIFLSFGLAMGITTAVSATYYVIYGVPYPGEGIESIRSIMAYCLVAIAATFAFGVYSYWAGLKAILPKRKPKKPRTPKTV
jgi:hypothetical protein